VTWPLAILAGSILLVASTSRLLSGTPVTPAMVFVAIGVLVGPLVLGDVDVPAGGETVRVLAEATLAVVLFSDASRIRMPDLRREYTVPLRLLGVGLPLTIAAGALLAAVLFGGLTAWEAVVLAVVLAPTDAALGQAVVTEPRLPSRIRQGLNVESGLNDGICVPLLLAALAAADVESNVTQGHSALVVLAQEIGYGVLAGVAAGLAAALLVALARRRNLATPEWLRVVPVAGAALAYGLADPLGGSGFIAAFLAGAAYGWLRPDDAQDASGFSDGVADVLDGVTFVIFGAVLLGPALEHVTWQVALYALLSLTAVRMVPVAIAMLGSGARPPTVAFLGWFGPRGLASIVFAVIAVGEARLPGASTILEATFLTIGLSVFAHGISAAPLARRYAAWSQSRPSGAMEHVPAPGHRPRGASAA
jgi:NhaP-type Na+/H+ or K+/H+ antiporter